MFVVINGFTAVSAGVNVVGGGPGKITPFESNITVCEPLTITFVDGALVPIRKAVPDKTACEGPIVTVMPLLVTVDEASGTNTKDWPGATVCCL